MTPGEVGRLLGLAARVDNRKQSDAATEAWWEILEPYGYDDAVVALRVHRRESTEWLLPAHLVAIMDDWDRIWLDSRFNGPRPAGWPEVSTGIRVSEMTEAQRRQVSGLPPLEIEQ